MHEISDLFLGNTSHTPNKHTHSSLKEKQSKISRNQNPKPAKKKDNCNIKIQRIDGLTNLQLIII